MSDQYKQIVDQFLEGAITKEEMADKIILAAVNSTPPAATPLEERPSMSAQLAKKSRIYIYVQENGKPVFKTAHYMIGVLKPFPENECGLFSNCFPAEGQEIYEVWFADYLEQHPDSTSDLMLDAGITHQSVLELCGELR